MTQQPQYAQEMYYPVQPVPAPGYYQAYYQPHPGYEQSPRYIPYAGQHRYDPYTDYERNRLHQGLPDPGSHELPSPRSAYPKTQSSYDRSPSVESEVRASPMTPIIMPSHIQGSEAERKKVEQNERRKKRNREAQQKARRKQKETIESLRISLEAEKRKNDHLEQQLAMIQKELELVRNQQYVQDPPQYSQERPQQLPPLYADDQKQFAALDQPDVVPFNSFVI